MKLEVKLVLLTIIVAIGLFGCRTDSKDYIINIERDIVLSEALTLKPVDKGIILVQHSYPWSANSLILELTSGEIILIDTPYTSEATEQVVDWIRNQSEKEVEFIGINTHFHMDNLGGNQYLISQGIEIIASSKTADMIVEKGEDSLKHLVKLVESNNNTSFKETFQKFDYVKPTKLIEFNEDMVYELNIGDDKLELYYPKESHAPDVITVYYQNKKLLFAGCMVRADEAQSLGDITDANLPKWKESIGLLQELYSVEEVEFLIPGHGDFGDITLLKVTEELLDSK